VDPVEYTARSWRATDRMLAVCAQLEQRFGLDPLLLDRLDEKAAVFVLDARDEDAKVELDVALVDFLTAAVEAMD
jgi:hypothetical protein